MTLRIEDIIDTREVQEPITVAFPGLEGFSIQVRPLLPGVMESFIEQARTPKWDEATLEQRMVVDKEKYAALFTDHVIAGWKGLDKTALMSLVLLNKKTLKNLKSMKGEIECDPKSKQMLYLYSPAFMMFTDRVAVDSARFNEERKKDLEKN